MRGIYYVHAYLPERVKQIETKEGNKAMASRANTLIKDKSNMTDANVSQPNVQNKDGKWTPDANTPERKFSYKKIEYDANSFPTFTQLLEHFGGETDITVEKDADSGDLKITGLSLVQCAIEGYNRIMYQEGLQEDKKAFTNTPAAVVNRATSGLRKQAKDLGIVIPETADLQTAMRLFTEGLAAKGINA